MMGQQTGGLERLFYNFNLDDHIPQNHLCRCQSSPEVQSDNIDQPTPRH